MVLPTINLPSPKSCVAPMYSLIVNCMLMGQAGFNLLNGAVGNAWCPCFGRDRGVNRS